MFFTGVLLAVLISPALGGPWAIICAGKSSNEIRTCDSHGCGQYTAQREKLKSAKEREEAWDIPTYSGSFKFSYPSVGTVG